jgi:Sulfotransferase family
MFQELLDLITSTSSENATIISRQTVRHALLKQVCPQLTDKQRSTAPDWSDFLVDDQRRYIFCKVEKVGCTSWKRTLLALTGEVPNAEKLKFHKVHSKFTLKHLTTLDSYKPAERRYRLETYYKFFFTRDPFARLVSAYRGKILRDPAYKELRILISGGGGFRKRSVTHETVLICSIHTRVVIVSVTVVFAGSRQTFHSNSPF